MEDKAAEYKVILLGDPGVGKTTFFLRLREQEFVDTEQRPSASIGVDDLLYEHMVDETKIKVYLHDTGGGERFRTLTSNFYRNASAAILMYSVDEMLSFQNLTEWIENLQSSMTTWDPDNFVWAVVGNKSDLPLEIEHDTILHLCKQQNTNLNFFTSAKTGENVKAAFEKIIEELHRKLSCARPSSQSSNQGNIKIGGQRGTTSASGASKGKQCC